MLADIPRAARKLLDKPAPSSPVRMSSFEPPTGLPACPGDRNPAFGRFAAKLSLC
jgi:hypothetical protein